MRKQPKQKRSRLAVDALLDATAQVIAQRGLEQTTTNHIAERAGVSVGSLYQYFEGKDDLIEALMVRLSREISVAVDATLESVMDENVETVVSNMLNVALTAMEKEGSVHLELARNWDRLNSFAGVNALEEHMMEAGRRYALRHHRNLRIDNLPAVLFVLINSTLFTVMRYLNMPDPPITRAELIDTMSAMIASYLEPAKC